MDVDWAMRAQGTTSRTAQARSAGRFTKRASSRLKNVLRSHGQPAEKRVVPGNQQNSAAPIRGLSKVTMYRLPVAQESVTTCRITGSCVPKWSKRVAAQNGTLGRNKNASPTNQRTS